MIPAEVLAALGDARPYLCRQTHIHWENLLITKEKRWLVVCLIYVDHVFEYHLDWPTIFIEISVAK